MSEDSGGGFLVPVEYAKEIHAVALENELAEDMPGGEGQLMEIMGKGLAWYRGQGIQRDRSWPTVGYTQFELLDLCCKRNWPGRRHDRVRESPLDDVAHVCRFF